MMSNLSPWILLVFGFLLGFVVEWLIELWFWRGKQIARQQEAEALRSKLSAQAAELAAANAHIAALKAEIAAHSRDSVPSESVPIVTAAPELPSLEVLDVSVPAPDLAPPELPDVDLAAPDLPPPEAPDAELPTPDLTQPEVPDVEPAEPDFPPVEVPDIERVQPDLPPLEVPNIELEEPEVPDVLQPHLPDIDAIPPEEDFEVSIPEQPPFDDLTLIKGIGAKFAAILNEAGIHTFAELTQRTPEELHAIVNPPAWRKVETATWIEQAQMLMTSPPPETMGDDLTLIDGIGATFAARLQEAGIDSFAALAAADEDTLAQVIKAPEWRRPDFADWISQAQTLLAS